MTHIECNEDPRHYDKRKSYGMAVYVFRVLIRGISKGSYETTAISYSQLQCSRTCFLEMAATVVRKD